MTSNAKAKGVFIQSPDEKPLSDKSTILWGIVGILLIGACASLALFLASDDALRARLFMVNQDRTIKQVTASQIHFIHSSGLALFIGFLSFVTMLNWQRTRANRVAAYLFEDARTFVARIVKGAREWVVQARGVEIVCLVLIFLIALAIRLFFATQPIGYDEAITVVRFSSRTLLDVVSDYSVPNNHVLHTILVHVSSKLFGILPVVVRLPAFCAGLMIVPLSFWLIRRLFNDHTALLTAGLTAVAPAMVEYSAQARGYTLLTLLFLIAFVVATYLKEQSSITGWAIFVITLTLGFYTIPTMVYPSGIVAIWLLFAAPKQKLRTLFAEVTVASITIALGTLLLYLPIILHSGYRRLVAHRELVRLSLLPFLNRNATNALFTLRCWTGSHNVPFIIAISLSVVAAILFSWRNKRSAIFVPLAILLWMVPLICLQRVAPFPRVFNFLFPIVAGFASYGLSIAFEKLPIRSNQLAQYVWVALVLVISTYSGISRLVRPCTPIPGAEGINQCAEGFFVDAKPIISDLKPLLGERAVLVAHVHSGIVESAGFYLLEAKMQPTLVYAYDPVKGLHQLDQYDGIFVATRRDAPQSQKDEDQGDKDEDQGDIEKMFRCSHEDFEKEFDKPELVARYQISDVYQLHRKSNNISLVKDQPTRIVHY